MAAFLFVVTIPLETDSDPEIAEEEDGEEDARETTDTPKAVKTGEQEGTEASTTDAGTGESQGQNQHGEQDGSVGDQPKVLLGKQDSTECESFTLEEAVQTLLAILQIEKDVWQKSESCGFNQVSFIVETEKVDTVLRRLTLLGIGRIPETSVTLFPAQSHFVGIDNLEVKGPVDSSPQKECSPEEISERSEFYKSVKARLTVAQVVAGVSANAKLTFDHLMLIILASCIAALGLSENSSVVLVASMLISPLMGPILGFTFGIVVENRELWKMSLRNSGIGLVLCLAMGFLIGLVTGAVHVHSQWGGDMAYPTFEMSNRGLYYGLLVGMMIALASGAGVALAVLGGNTASLVGAAISASLLPPAVNAGMLWAFALLMAGHQPSNVIQTSLAENDTNTIQSTFVYQVALSNCTKLPGNSYKFRYSCFMSEEAFYLGGVSLLLTLLNEVCICIMGYIILKLKEVVPHTAVSAGTETFWKKDIKIARDAYRTLKGKESLDLANFARTLAKGTKTKIAPGVSKTYHGMDGAELYRDFLEELEQSPHYQDIVQRLPNGIRTSLLNQVSSDDEFYSEPRTPGSLFSESSPMLTPEVLPSGGRNRQVIQQNTFGTTAASVVVPAFRARYRNEPKSPSVTLEDIRWLFDEPPAEESNKVMMEYAVPRKRKRASHRKQIMRMPSAPAKVRVVPASTNHKSRFKVTVIQEEE